MARGVFTVAGGWVLHSLPLFFFCADGDRKDVQIVLNIYMSLHKSLHNLAC